MAEIDRPEEICYVQNFEQFRSLNKQLNHVPVLATTLTSGLWFGAGATENLGLEVRFALLMLAGLSNIALILAVHRIRDVMESYLEHIRSFHSESFATGRPESPRLSGLGRYSLVQIYCTLMLIAAGISFIGAFWKYWPFAISSLVGVLIFAIFMAFLYFLLFTRKNESG